MACVRTEGCRHNDVHTDWARDVAGDHLFRSRMQTPHYVQIRPCLGFVFGFGSKDVHGGP
jgi:hypothetical protein